MMAQARRSNRKVNAPKQQLIGHGLREIVLIFFCFIGLYLFVSLLTYYPGDPGWSHSGQVDEVRNNGGVAGAVFADIFFLLFGYFAYLFPVMVGYIGWLIYQGKHHDILADPKALIIPGVGFILTLVAGCGLAIVHFYAESGLLPSHAGGLLGTWVGHWLVGIVDPLGATLILMAMFFTGITLLTGLSWLKLMDTLGYHTLQWLPVVKKYASRHFFPWLMRHARKFLLILAELFKNGFQKLRLWTRATYTRWQDRRNAWRRERERYEEDYYDENEEEEDEFFRKDERGLRREETSEPLKSTATTIQVATIDELSPVVEQATATSSPAPSAPLSLTSAAVSSQSLLPELSLFNPTPHPLTQPSIDELSQWLAQGFQSLQVKVEIQAVHPGPVLTGFEVSTITPINASHLEELNEALSKVLEVPQVWTVETYPGVLSIEVPTLERQTIYLSELLNSPDYQQNLSPLPIALGRDLDGQPIIVDLTHIPHILMAGSVADEKAMAIHTLVLSLLFKATPSQLRLLLVDNLNHDLAIYANLPYLLMPLLTSPDEVPRAFKWCLEEMERRYRVMAKMGMRNVDDYNKALAKQESQEEGEAPKEMMNAQLLAYIVVIVPEIAEIIKPTGETKLLEDSLTHLTQKARAAGIHLILATQYPSVNVVTGLLKANISTRMAFQVTTKTESRTILGQMGAENLLGQGDMLYLTAGTGVPVRVHGSFVTDREVQRIVADLKARATPDYVLLKSEEGHEL